MPASHPWPQPVPAAELRSQRTALVFGVVLLVVGLFGMLVGVVWQDVVNVLFGLAGIWLARCFPGARRYLIGGGLGYLAVATLGLVTEPSSWLPVALAVAMIAAGAVSGPVDHQHSDSFAGRGGRA